MESRVSYAVAGVFVMVLSAALVALGLWIGSGSSVKDYDRYSIYFEESVSGLNRNAPVKYRGVVVGRVEQIELAKDNPERVHLVVAIEEGTPIKTDTKAKLDPQGVTGIVHVELTGGTQEAPMLDARPGKPYPVIESAPSLISRLDQALTRGLENLDKLSRQVSEVLSPENQESLRRTLTNLERFSATLADNSERIDRTLVLAEQTLQGTARASEKLPDVLAEITETMDRWDALADSLDETSAEVRQLAESGAQELNAIGRDTVPQVNELLVELRVLAESMTRLSDELRENPRMLLFGRPDGAPGPGEE